MLRFEERNDVFLGSFELKENAFLSRCGVAVNSVGRVYTRLNMEEGDLTDLKEENTPMPKTWFPKPKRKARSQNAAVQAVQVVSSKTTSEDACQTDATVEPPASSTLRGDAPAHGDLA